MKEIKEDIIRRIEGLYIKFNEKSKLQNEQINIMETAKSKVADYEIEIVNITKELNEWKKKLFGLLGEKQ